VSLEVSAYAAMDVTFVGSFDIEDPNERPHDETEQRPDDPSLIAQDGNL
jgi:hypothetical protein